MKHRWQFAMSMVIQSFIFILMLVTSNVLSANPANPDACLISPVTATAPQLITNIYGCRFHPKREKWLPHNGVDFRAFTGTPLIAARAGVVTTPYTDFGGQEVRIHSETGQALRYLHLSRTNVKPGSRVSIGQNIGLAGATGLVTAAHLHFETIKNQDKAQSSIHLDPESLLCKKMEHKPGAEESGGYRIYPPVNGICNGKSSAQSAFLAAMHASHLFSWLTLPLAKLTASAADEDSESASIAPTVEQFDDTSKIETLFTEILKRFANPAWHIDQAERSSVPLLNEYIQMKALENFLAWHKQQIQERIETLLAIRLTRQNLRYRDEHLLPQRQSAAQAASH